MNREILNHILLLGAIVAVFVALYLRYGQNITLSFDEKIYYEIAQALLDGRSYTENTPLKWDIGEILMPGYSFIMFGFFYLFGNNLFSFIIFQTVLAGISIYFFYLIANRSIKINPYIALLFTLMLLAYYPLWRQTFMTFKEVFTIILMVPTIFYLHLFFKRGKPKDCVILYILFAILVAVMNRYIAHVLLFTFALGIFIILKGGYKEVRLKHLLLSGFLFLAVMAPWHYRQYLVYDQLVLFSPTRSENASEPSDTKKEPVSYEEAKKTIMESGFSDYRKKQTLKNFTPELYQDLIDDYHERNTFEVFFSRLKGFFSVYENDFRLGYGTDSRFTPPASLFNRLANTLVFGTCFLLMIPGLYFALKRRNYFILAMYIFFFSHVALHVYVHYLHRYRMTILPITIIIAAWTFDILFKKIKVYMQQKKKPLSL